MSFSKDLANAIRALSIDAVEKAQSGHPGMPLGMADIATVLWKKYLRHNPKNPLWFNRDRFILSNGHGSMLHYSLLHLTGYQLDMNELQHFRQLNSKTPGHPEHGDTPGIETTTGPLGQGLANGVGTAVAEKVMAGQFNKKQHSIVDHYTYVFAGDGCLMEGISHEACSLAGTLQLGKLIVFYDDNGVSIDGQVKNWFTDDTAKRFESYQWQVIADIDGHDMEAVDQAIEAARANTTQPTLIICKTIIGLGSSKAGSEKSHGAPLGPADVQQVKEFMHWPYEPFEIPEKIYNEWNHLEEGQKAEQEWLDSLQQYKKAFQQEYQAFLRRINGDLPDDWQKQSEAFIEQCRASNKATATRKASQQCIEYFASQLLPEMFGGSADLTGSNNTTWSGSKAISETISEGNYLYYGVREFAMAAMMNGIALHGGLIPYGGTFLVFLDYARNAVRLSALMEQRVIYVFTHDSLGLGEDGPTHQPVEHATILRATPNMTVWRPADLMETAVAWQQALEHHNGPTSLLLSRQSVPALSHSEHASENIKKGAYIIQDCESEPDVILIATGSEVHLAMEAAEAALSQYNQKIRVISMPCAERFLEQDASYRKKILPESVPIKIALEAGSPAYWYRFVGLEGDVIGLERFGVSAPGKQALEYLGFNVDNILNKINELVSLSN